MRRWLSLPLVCLAAFAGGATFDHLALARPKADSPYELLDQLARVLVVVENEYVEPVDRRRLVEGSIQGMVAALDPHSEYMTPEQYALFQSDTTGRFGGVGIEVDFRDDFITIVAPMDGSPAARAGVHPGDRILAIDGQSTQGKTPDALIRQMRGAPGTKVRLTLKRAGAQKLIELELVREVIEVTSVEHKLLDGGIGYLRIKQFQDGTHEELLRAVAALRRAAHGALAGVLVDLRNDPGGLVDEASAVADEMLEGGVIYTTRHRGRVVDEARAGSGGALRSGRMLVLVNEYTASAAELLAGALQDSHRARVIGARTYGKGSVQSILDLPGGAGLKLTTMRYYTPSGRAIQAQGIAPDVPVASPGAGGSIEHEADLPNALSAEGPTAPATPPPASGSASAASPVADDGLLGVSREVPANPSGGKDRALAVAYDLLRGTD